MTYIGSLEKNKTPDWHSHGNDMTSDGCHGRKHIPMDSIGRTLPPNIPVHEYEITVISPPRLNTATLVLSKAQATEVDNRPTVQWEKCDPRRIPSK